MKLETFFEKFDQFADSPDAVSKMRGLILRLAMQGKLSEPHKTDGPVSELLREVEKEKRRLGFESSGNATSVNSDFSDNATADFIPERWTWVRFGNIARHNAGKTLDKGRNRGELRDYITTSNLYWGFFQVDAVRQMPMLDDELERCTAIKGDLLICEGGEAGRAAVWPHDREISFQNHVHRARFFAGINPYFVQRYLEKLNATGEIEKYRKGVGISNMSGKALASILIPLPPLAEQKRIVAKVDELMALCDRLEAQQQERETQHAALVRASLARFADAPTPANLNFLFHPSYAVPPADLRKSILTLAVQGKLVPQDSNDEPAIASLDEIEPEKAALIAARKLRPNRITEISQTKALQYDAPDSWRWFRLGDVAFFQEGPGIRNWQFRTEGIKLLNVQNIVDGKLVLENTDRHISTEEFESSYQHFAVEAGDILFASSGASWGKTAWFVDPGYTVMLNTSMVRLKFYSARCDDAFLLLFLRTEFFKTQMKVQLVGIQPNFGSTHLGRVYIPLPPLAEQRRIVAKVDQLMALVDQLETQLTASAATAGKLMEAVVAELTAQA